MGLSIRWRLTLWYGAVLAVVLTAFGTAVYFTQRHHALRRLDRALSEELADVLSEVRRARDDRGLTEWLERRFARHEGFDFQNNRPPLTLPSPPGGEGRVRGGDRFFVSQRLAGTILPLPEESSLSGSPSYRDVTGEGGRSWRVVSVQIQGPSDALTVQVARPLEGFDHESRELLFALLLTGPLALLVAVGGGYFLARRALAPVEQIRRRTREITAERLDRRLPVPNPGDELGGLAQTINEMIGRLERSFVEVRRFTADASHELRTPLTAIRTEAEVALGRPAVSPEQQYLLGSILEECERLTRLTDQLLALSREDAGVGRQAHEPVDLAGVVAGVVETMRPLAESKGLSLRLDGGALWVRGDEARLRQVFYNLFDNAIKYTPEGGTVEVAAGRRGSSAVVTVRDTGIGIAAEHLPRVFDRFYRVDKARSRAEGGTGLGLSIAHSIVAAHDGHIELTSTPGNGTTCTVTLPADPEV
jgi:two-component system heavy metal sensor histidine kinase CusS